MKKIHFISIIILGAVLLSSCASKSAALNYEGQGFAEDVLSVPAAPAAMEKEFLEMSMDEEYSSNESYRYESGASVERIVIKNADITIVVEDPAETMDEVTKMAEEMKGFVVNSQLYKIQTGEGLEVPEASITIRVPSNLLQEALGKIKSHVENPDIDVLRESVSGTDVTKEYTDLNSRLKNLEQAEKQLTEIMSEARKTEDVLAVYNNLKQVGEEIEIIKGQIKYYEEAAALSAINIQLKSKESVQPLTIGRWQPVGVARDALQALINTLKFLANAAIWIIIFILPVLLIIAIPIWLVIRFFVRRNKKKKLNMEEKINK